MSFELFKTPGRAANSSNGVYNGAKWYFYQTGTTTPQTVYQDSALTTPHANPVVADEGGKFPAIYLNSSLTYRAVLKNSSGSETIHDFDPINSINEIGELTFDLGVTGSVERSANSKMGDIVSVKDFGAVGDGTTNDTAAFSAALTYILTLTNGGEIYIPPGTYRMDMDLTDTTPNGEFFKKVTVRGAGRGVTTIRPAAASSIILNMHGRNRATIMDFSIDSGDVYTAQTAIYVARRDLSGNPGNGNANNNKFINIEVSGSYSRHAVTAVGMESSLWLNCKFEPTGATTYGCFWAGTDPSLCGITPTSGTSVTGPATDNRMLSCEFYVPYDNAKGFIFSTEVGYVIDGHAFIFGSAIGVKMVTIKDFTSGVFNGPIQFRNCHWEAFATSAVNNYGIWVEGTGVRYIYGLDITGGLYVVDNYFVALDYAARGTAEGLILFGGTFITPALASGYAGSAAIRIYANSMYNCLVFWRHRGSLAGITLAGGSATTTFLGVDSLTSPSNNTSIILKQQTSVQDPATMTYVAPAGGATVDAEARASLAQLAADATSIRTRLIDLITRMEATGLIATV